MHVASALAAAFIYYLFTGFFLGDVVNVIFLWVLAMIAMVVMGQLEDEIGRIWDKYL